MGRARERVGAMGGALLLGGFFDGRFALLGLGLMAAAARWPRRRGWSLRGWGHLEQLCKLHPNRRWQCHGGDLFSGHGRNGRWPVIWARYVGTSGSDVFDARFEAGRDPDPAGGRCRVAFCGGRLERLGLAVTPRLLAAVRPGDRLWLREDGWLCLGRVADAPCEDWRPVMDDVVQGLSGGTGTRHHRIQRVRCEPDPLTRFMLVLAAPEVFERRPDPAPFVHELELLVQDARVPRPTRLAALRLLAGRVDPGAVLAALHRLVFLQGQREDQAPEARLIRGLDAREIDAQVTAVRVLEDIGTRRALGPLSRARPADPARAKELADMVGPALLAIRKRTRNLPGAGTLSIVAPSGRLGLVDGGELSEFSRCG